MSDPVIIAEMQDFVVDGEVKITYDNVLELRKAFTTASKRLEFRTGVHLADGQTEALTSSEKKEYEQLLLIYQQLVDNGLKDIDYLTEFSIGGVAEFIGQTNHAKQHYLRALEISKKYESNTLNSLAYLAEEEDDLDEAERLYRESMAIDIEIGDYEGQSRALNNLGLIAEKRGDLGEAERLLRGSVSIYSDFEFSYAPHSKVISLKNLGDIVRQRGDLDEAENLHLECIDICKYYFMQSTLADLYYKLGIIKETRGNYVEARNMYLWSLEYYRDLEEPEGELLSYLHLLDLLDVKDSNNEEAERLIRKCLSLEKQIGDRRGESSSLKALSRIAKSRGNDDESERLLEESLAIDKEIGHIQNAEE